LLGGGPAAAVVGDLDLATGFGRRLALLGLQRRARQQRHPAAVLAQRGGVDAVLALGIVRVLQLAVQQLAAGLLEAGAQHAGLVLVEEAAVVAGVGQSAQRALVQQQGRQAGRGAPAQQIAAHLQDQLVGLVGPDELRHAGVEVGGLELVAGAVLLQFVAPLPVVLLDFGGVVLGADRGRCSRCSRCSRCRR
jgi:hypothetical protein